MRSSWTLEAIPCSGYGNHSSRSQSLEADWSRLKVKRPFSFINSRMYAQRRMDEDNHGALETFAEAQQRWHLWRRRYDLYMRYVLLQ